MKSSTAAAVATTLLLSGARAQQQYRIDPSSVSQTTRDFWCEQQTTQCPLICLDQGSSTGATSSNDCDPDALTYACVCDNGLSPNVSEYSNTLPYSICTEWGTQCVSNCAGNTECQSNCRSQHPCGAQNPTRQNTSTLTSQRSTSTSGSAADASASGTTSTTGSGSGNAQVTTESDGSTVTVFTGLAGQTTSDESAGVKNVRVWALGLGQTFGTLGVMGAAALGFAVFL